MRTYFASLRCILSRTAIIQLKVTERDWYCANKHKWRRKVVTCE